MPLSEEPVRVMALHSLAYCERLYYFEEVEGVMIADDQIYSGRALHDTIKQEDGGKLVSRELSSEVLGLTGKVDYINYRDGMIVPYELKRGRARRDGKSAASWYADALQVSAYGMLLEEELRCKVNEGRVRYNADNVTVRVSLDDEMRNAVLKAVERAVFLRSNLERPAVTVNDRLCIHCSLAPVCLPEEERFIENDTWEPIRLFPADHDLKTIHVMEHGTKITRRGDIIEIITTAGEIKQFPVNELEALVLHGYVQITTQAMQLCIRNEVALHWISPGQIYTAGIVTGPNTVQRRIRQYKALTDCNFSLYLSKALVKAKIETAIRYSLRATRGKDRSAGGIATAIDGMRKCLKEVDKVNSSDELRGYEGLAGKEYFTVFPLLLNDEVQEEMRYIRRSRRPPRDRINAILSFGYTLLYRTVLQAVLVVGLEPAFGFFHTPRSSAHPLALDLMELFRVQLWDIVVVGSINRNQWHIDSDFNVSPGRIWLSDSGRKKAVKLFEERVNQSWKHPVVNYSMTYSRLVELEVRLLEKEWSGSPGLFAKMRLR
ncbi:MAG: type I-MYXAN CRISPR-associated endonuclease Cas1 [Bacillota bacterium]|nr:type I-MYXAN CRISPR-associated endonuclease Cas1 [Bacillota bacterium]